MKAFVLAAGKGTRLKPYTDTTAKCLMPICGRPLLEIWLELLAGHGVDQVLVNLHHHHEQVRRFLENTDWRAKLAIETVYEPVLLGSAGTLWHNRSFVGRNEDFIIIYADNLTCLNLTKMIDKHRHFRSMGGILTMGVFRTTDPGSCGIVTCDQEGRIVDFVEKPQQPPGNLANGGIYVAAGRLWDNFPAPVQSQGPLDFGYHVLPGLVGKMFAYQIEEFLMDIGSPQNWATAQSRWRKIKSKQCQ